MDNGNTFRPYVDTTMFHRIKLSDVMSNHPTEGMRHFEVDDTSLGQLHDGILNLSDNIGNKRPAMLDQKPEGLVYLRRVYYGIGVEDVILLLVFKL